MTKHYDRYGRDYSTLPKPRLYMGRTIYYDGGPDAPWTCIGIGRADTLAGIKHMIKENRNNG